MQFTITRAAGEDAAQMLQFLNKVGGETDNLTFGEEGFPVDLAGETAYLKSNCTNPYNAVFVARMGDRIVGNASFTGSSRPRLCHRGDLGVSVLKEVWGCGIGTALTQAVIDHARDVAHAQLISLEVRCDNSAAVRLYEKFGFAITGTLPGFLKINGELVDCFTMTLTL